MLSYLSSVYHACKSLMEHATFMVSVEVPHLTWSHVSALTSLCADEYTVIYLISVSDTHIDICTYCVISHSHYRLWWCCLVTLNHSGVHNTVPCAPPSRGHAVDSAIAHHLTPMVALFKLWHRASYHRPITLMIIMCAAISSMLMDNVYVQVNRTCNQHRQAFQHSLYHIGSYHSAFYDNTQQPTNPNNEKDVNHWCGRAIVSRPCISYRCW